MTGLQPTDIAQGLFELGVKVPARIIVHTSLIIAATDSFVRSYVRGYISENCDLIPVSLATKD
jgi:hypothetical protein